jgi:hypothetical protein
MFDAKRDKSQSMNADAHLARHENASVEWFCVLAKGPEALSVGAGNTDSDTDAVFCYVFITKHYLLLYI